MPATDPIAIEGGARHGANATPGQDAAHEVERRSTVELHLPVLGRLTVPVDHLGWYAAVVGLAAVDILDWPIAAVVVIGKVLSDNHRYRLLEQFGRALDELAV
jgi:hypothetical protein